MNTTKLPGFSAEAAVYSSNNHYRARAFLRMSNFLTLATRKNGKLEWIDCNNFPENNYCRECGNTGPDSLICCPDDYCAVIDKTPRAAGNSAAQRSALGMLSARRQT